MIFVGCGRFFARVTGVQDEESRRGVCEPDALWGALEADDRGKASAFFVCLHEKILPMWVRDERRGLMELVDEARAAYLVC